MAIPVSYKFNASEEAISSINGAVQRRSTHVALADQPTGGSLDLYLPITRQRRP
jgi:hypothetical protein